MKAQPLEQRPGAFMVRHHLHGDFSKLQNAGQGHNLRAEPLSEAPGLPLGCYVDLNLADLPRPSKRVHVEAGVTRQRAVRLGQKSDRGALLDTLYPLVRVRRVRDITAQKRAGLPGEGYTRTGVSRPCLPHPSAAAKPAGPEAGHPALRAKTRALLALGLRPTQYF